MRGLLIGRVYDVIKIIKGDLIMIVVKCDRCGNQIVYRNSIGTSGENVFEAYTRITENTLHELLYSETKCTDVCMTNHLCQSCRNDFVKMINEFYGNNE